MGDPNGAAVSGQNLNSTINGDDTSSSLYSVNAEAAKVLQDGLLSNPLISRDLPPETFSAASAATKYVKFTGSDTPSLPINWRLAEASAALKALEAAVVNVLLQRKYGLVEPQEVEINTDQAPLFSMSCLLWTVDPDGENIAATLGKSQELARYFPACDLHRMHSGSLHRAAATNIYRCADGRYFHLHGSLNADPTLEAIGMPMEDDRVQTYRDAVQPFIDRLETIPSEEMQRRVTDVYKQAGTICYSIDEFKNSEHGKANAHVHLWEIHDHHQQGAAAPPPSWWPDSPQTSPSRPLAGLKVVDLTRIIAGPAITRSLAELGASVMRCTASHLPDFGNLHVDLNWGKWNCHIDLREPADREKLRALIMDADVVVQGYRPGVLDKYGFGQRDIITMCEGRDCGIISVQENCYGWHGPWRDRSGWQQISDANTGVSLSFGQSMGLNEPVTPVFPNSDYSTGITGSIAIMIALLRRAQRGGSYRVDLALNSYNRWLIDAVGTYPPHVFDKVWAENGRPVFRSWHNMGYTIPAVMATIAKGPGGKRMLTEDMFEERKAEGVLGRGNGKVIRAVRPIARWKGGVVRLGYNVGTRGNGVDRAVWPEDLMVENVV